MCVHYFTQNRDLPRNAFIFMCILLYVQNYVRYSVCMNTTERRKNAGMATGQEQSNWHPADIKAALDKVGWSLRQLSLHSGLSANAVGHALRRPYPRAELIIASAIGYKPNEIWPTRYNSEGQPKKSLRKSRAKIPHNLVRQFNKAEQIEKPLSEVTDD